MLSKSIGSYAKASPIGFRAGQVSPAPCLVRHRRDHYHVNINITGKHISGARPDGLQLCKGGATITMTVAKSDVDVEKEVGEATKNGIPVIIYFTADYCGPCKLVAKELQRLDLVRKAKPVKILTVDSQSSGSLATRLGISALPTLLFVGTAGPSEPVIRTQGVVSKQMIADILDNKLHFAGTDLTRSKRLF